MVFVAKNCRRCAFALFTSVGLAFSAAGAFGQESQGFTLPGVGEHPGEEWSPRFWNEGNLSLLDAVRIALGHNPSLYLRAESARFASGVATEESGRFDPVIASDLSFESFRQELLDSEKKSQRENREALRKDIAETQADLVLDRRILDQITRLQQDPGALRVEDADLQAQIDLYRELIDELDGARKTELVRQLGSLLADSRKNYEDEIGELSAEVDQNTLRLTKLGAAPNQERSEDGKLDFKVRFPSRHGFTLAPFFQYTYRSDRFVNKRRSSDFGGKGVKDLFTSRLGLGFDSPLLRGLGKSSAAAGETAAKIGFSASVADVRHEATSSAFGATLAYWDAVAAEAQVSALAESLGRQDDLLEMTEALIKGDEIPAAEKTRVEARQATARAALDQAKRAAHERRLALAGVIGLAIGPDAEAPKVSDALPAPPSAAEVSVLDAAAFATDAVERREDLKAARGRLDADEVRATAAALDRKPRLDLASSLWYGAREESSAGQALNGSWAGPSYRLGLDLELPIGNRTQAGRYLQALANRDSSRIVADDLKRRIGNNLALLLGSLAQAIDQAERSREAADSYRRLVEGEKERYRSKLSSPIDTLLSEQQLTDARLAQIAAEAQCAALVTRLRFETGTLVDLDDQGGEISIRSLTTLPGSS